MNFVAWFANMLIDFFGFENDMAIGLSVIAGGIVMFAIFISFSVMVSALMLRTGMIKE